MLLTLRIPTWPAQRFLLTIKNRQDIHGAQSPAPSPTHPPQGWGELPAKHTAPRGRREMGVTLQLSHPLPAP